MPLARMMGAAVLPLALTFAAASAQAPDTAFARVTYVSGASVYVDAGARDGLAEGAELTVVRAGRAAATLRARFLSPSRAQCELVSGPAPAVGDTVRFARAREVVATPDTAAVVQPVPVVPRTTRRTDGLRGRFGVRYLGTWQRDSGQGGVSQPAADARLDGPIPGAPSLRVALDARGRRTRSVAIDGAIIGTRTSTLVYQSSLGWRSGGGAHVTVGRQYAGQVASVSLFDGALAGVERTRFGLGAFAGSQPDAETMGYSTRVREYGVYASARSHPDLPVSWSATSGAIGSYDSGQLDREFGFVAASIATPVLSLFGLQELDYNRGWKRASGEPALSPTSTYLSARARVSDAVSIHGGYDSRRSVRLYRNYVTPEIAFDDAYRTGVWGGLFANLRGAASASLDARHSAGGASGQADIYSLNVAARRSWRVPFDARARTSWYDTPAARGWLQSVAIGASPADYLRLEGSGGARIEHPAPGTALAATSIHHTVGWMELNADVSLGRSWYVMLSATRERGGWDSSDQFYTALTWRF